MDFLAKASTSFAAAYVHLMLLPLCMSIWPPGPPVTAGWQVRGQRRGGKGAVLGIEAKGRKVPANST
ncbi:hypothetical protein PBY51_013609 [Eleginops maclovinus]|uniref:Uncharacterized protein n=1 Tax=Eleginops maclovinus TaxID=56733 RepID=A0AAN7Y681_ELEMC|nr:hypothetical protein PBY51_013609 [Eleginops maclovinus]